MHVCCLDLEGVLIPEIWIHVAKQLHIPELKLTTRDIPNYDQLMRTRLKILKAEKITLQQIQRVIGLMRPLPGAKTFLKKLKAESQVIILSDTFYEFSLPLMKQLDYPTLFCNRLQTNSSGSLVGYRLRQKDGKRKAVLSLKKLGFHVRAAGDSYNDLTMLQAADLGVFFCPPAQIRKIFPQFKIKELSIFPIKIVNFKNIEEREVYKTIINNYDMIPKITSMRAIQSEEYKSINNKIDKSIYRLYNIDNSEIEAIEKYFVELS